MNTTARRIVLTFACVAAAGSLTGIVAQTRAHVIQSPKDAQWGPAPPMLPAGAQIAVLAGDPGKAAPYTVRLKFPGQLRDPRALAPHRRARRGHERDALVRDGRQAGEGGREQDAGGRRLRADAGRHEPLRLHRRAEATIVLYGQGPVEFKYVNPADDPRNAKQTTR